MSAREWITHRDISELAESIAKMLGLLIQVHSGAYVAVSPQEKCCIIQGDSTSYGQADKQMAAELMRDFLPKDYTVTVR